MIVWFSLIYSLENPISTFQHYTPISTLIIENHVNTSE